MPNHIFRYKMYWIKKRQSLSSVKLNEKKIKKNEMNLRKKSFWGQLPYKCILKTRELNYLARWYVYYSPNAIIYTRRVFFLWCIVSAVNGRWDPARSVCIDESPLQPVDKINPPLQLATGSNNYRQQIVSGQLWSFMQYSKILR